MSRKFSIWQKIDLAKLDKMIDTYQCYTGETNPYLLMNKSTIDAIPAVDNTMSNLRQIDSEVNGIIGCLHGYKIFRDDTLEFGEVKIR